jgi:hypothetical protein
MSHGRGFLHKKCPGNFKKYQKRKEGWQQYKCSRCGQLQRKKVAECWFGLHTYPMHRPRKNGTVNVRCKTCGKLKVFGR